MGRRVRVQGMVTFCSINVSTVILGEVGVQLSTFIPEKSFWVPVRELGGAWRGQMETIQIAL